MTGNLCLTEGTAHQKDTTVLSDWKSVMEGAQSAIDSGTNAVKQVASAAAESVKTAAIEAGQVYAINHPLQTKFAVATSVLVFTGAVAGLLAIGYIVAKQRA